MTNDGTGSARKKGNIWPFWAIVGLAAVLLIAYLASGGGFNPGMTGSRGSRKLISVSQRRMLPKATLQSVWRGDDYENTSSWYGKVIIIHFWATWCPPCKQEYPEFAEYVKDNDSENIVVVPISLDRNRTVVTSYMKKIHAKFPVYIGAMDFATEIGIHVIPTTVLVDKKGRIAWKHSGAVDWSEKGIPALAQQLANSDD